MSHAENTSTKIGGKTYPEIIFFFDDNPIRQYISEHGFGPKKPTLTNTLPATVFKQHYYDKKELVKFCRSVAISTSGLKNDLNNKIELYLRTGQISAEKPKKNIAIPDSNTGLSLNKIVVSYKSDLDTRRFFMKHIPEFTGFSALVQKQTKQRLADGEEFTYGDIIEMHKNFLKNKAAGKVTTVAHDSCQFNQFYIDYSHDLSHKVHAAKEAWILIRESPGEKTYQRYKRKIEAIRDILKLEEE